MTQDFGSEELTMDAIKLAQAVVRNPMVRGVVHRGFELRDQALKTQTAMLGAMNLPTAADLAQVASRLRSISQRLDLLEDALSRVDQGVIRMAAAERTRAAAEEATRRAAQAEASIAP